MTGFTPKKGRVAETRFSKGVCPRQRRYDVTAGFRLPVRVDDRTALITHDAG